MCMLPSILIGAVVLIAVIFAVRSVLKNRHACDGDCASCGASCSVRNPEALKKELIEKIRNADTDRCP